MRENWNILHIFFLNYNMIFKKYNYNTAVT